MKNVSLDGYVVGTLMRDLVAHDRQPSAFLVYLMLWKLTEGGRVQTPPISHNDLAELCGLSERSVQSAIRALVQRKLLTLEKTTARAARSYLVKRPWRRRN